MITPSSIVTLVARILIAGVFIFSAAGKLRRDQRDMRALVGLHLPFPNFLATAAGACEITGALMLIFGVGARAAALLLSIFLLCVIFAFLRFWEALDDDERFGKENAFFGNFGLIGGLIYIAANGPGSLALWQGI